MNRVERDEVLARLANDIEELMVSQKFSIAKLARRADVSAATIHNILHARPCHVDKLMAILTVLGARFDYVLHRDT